MTTKQNLLEAEARVTTEPTQGAEYAAEFLRACVEYLGAGFHPDTPFGDYIDLSTRIPTFSAREASRLDAAMECVFEVLDDPYALDLDS